MSDARNDNVFSENIADKLAADGKLDPESRPAMVTAINDEILRQYRDTIAQEIAANVAADLDGTQKITPSVDLAQRVIRKMHNYGFHWVGTSEHGSAVQVLAFLLGEIWTEIDQKSPIEPPNYLSKE